MDLTIVQDDGDVVKLEIKGSITLNDLAPRADLLEDVLGDACYGRKVLLDLGGADFIDSSGISWLLVRHKRFREAGGKLIIHSLQPLVRNVVEVLRMDRVFKLAADEMEAQGMVVEGKK